MKSAHYTFCIPKLLSPSHRWQYLSIETRASLNFETDRWRRALPCTLKQCIRDQGICVYRTCRWSISLSDPRTLRSFASYSDTLRSLYSDAAVAAPGTACTRHPAGPLLWLSRPLYFWRLGLPFERDVPRLVLVVLFLWYKYIDVNVALLGKGGSEPRKEAAKALTAASHDINIILFWPELLLQLWLPHGTGWLLSANANVRIWGWQMSDIWKWQMSDIWGWQMSAWKMSHNPNKQQLKKQGFLIRPHQGSNFFKK